MRADTDHQLILNIFFFFFFFFLFVRIFLMLNMAPESPEVQHLQALGNHISRTGHAILYGGYMKALLVTQLRRCLEVSHALS